MARQRIFLAQSLKIIQCQVPGEFVAHIADLRTIHDEGQLAVIAVSVTCLDMVVKAHSGLAEPAVIERGQRFAFRT